MLVRLWMLLICLLMRLIVLLDLFNILSGCVPPLCTRSGSRRICTSWRHIQAIIIGTGICCGHCDTTRWILKTASHFVRENLLAGNIWIVTARNVIVLLALRCLLYDMMLLNLHLLLNQLLVLLLLLMMLIDQLLLVQLLLILSTRPPNSLFARAPCTSMVLWHFDNFVCVVLYSCLIQIAIDEILVSRIFSSYIPWFWVTQHCIISIISFEFLFNFDLFL